jgi:hypothetical protein
MKSNPPHHTLCFTVSLPHHSKMVILNIMVLNTLTPFPKLRASCYTLTVRKKFVSYPQLPGFYQRMCHPRFLVELPLVRSATGSGKGGEGHGRWPQS